MITPTPEFWSLFKETSGALSCAEALAIINVCSQVPYEDRIIQCFSVTSNGSGSQMRVESANLYYEFGSYHGKSAMSAIYGLKPGRFMLVDPIFSDTKLSSEVIFKVFDFGKNIAVGTSEMTYVEELNHLPNEIKFSYVMVDIGSHQDGLPMQEALLLEDRMVTGGIIAWHDFGNQFREPKEAAEYLVSTGKYEWINIDWGEIFEYLKESGIGEDDNNSWHKYPELPHPSNFLGAIRRK